MLKAGDVASDIVACGSALAGLLLVYMGALASAFSGFELQEKRAVLRSHQLRAWFAFVGLAFALLSVILGLAGRWLNMLCIEVNAMVFIVLSFAWVVTVATLTVLEIR